MISRLTEKPVDTPVTILFTSARVDPHIARDCLALLSARSHRVYTGLAFFRQLPAGVPGAYRLFANLLGLARQGQGKKP